jgi:hypothetical protein
MVELQPVELQEIGKERGWRHAKAPLHVRFEHHDFSGVRGWHQGFEVNPPVGLRLGGHGTLVLQGLDVSILDMAFFPVPMEVLGNLLFFSLGALVLLLLFGLAIRFFIRGLFCGRPRHLLLGFGCNIFWIRIRH